MESIMPFNPNDPATWNVVICDDEVDSIGVIEFVCNYYGTKTRTAEGGVRCLELLREATADILFLDIQMPDLSGWEVLNKIRADPALKGIVVIAVTAKAMANDRERALNAGFDAYFPKPISPATMIQDVIDILKKRIELC
jgi:CheY-like chemotaxis protein